jgi:hypothetical protein
LRSPAAAVDGAQGLDAARRLEEASVQAALFRAIEQRQEDRRPGSRHVAGEGGQVLGHAARESCLEPGQRPAVRTAVEDECAAELDVAFLRPAGEEDFGRDGVQL